ncbi:toprim domain-containing protein [Methylovulum psychrotolerans]|uniref:Toprim domain-containing protein n=1 Tax=Methylovulum psychrotolerans TaxID=1704499 RepID=A0A2S5CGE7_9GAMM|nr:toprim domain-containing protein [Methylovulum psychrotolerans]POZ49875.1 hypothetical protein AADEFJLK_04321 [Methylovulum psychrotolerans]
MYLPDINQKVVGRLISEFEMKVNGKYLYGRCPQCKKREKLWAGVEQPWMIRCNSAESCGYQITAKELFPDLYQDLSKQYRATEANPNYTADIFMQNVRGFDLAKIAGWYEQGWFGHPDANKGSATVRFYLTPDRLNYWERLVDEVMLCPVGETPEPRKMNFKGKFGGLWWQPPGLVINANDEIYLTEAILKAIALNVNGYKAVSCMSSGTFPEKKIKEYAGRGITWIIALDNDSAGLAGLHKFAKALRVMGEKVCAILSSDNPDIKQDWDDLHKLGKLTAKDMELYRHFGKVELATNSRQKAYYLWLRDDKQRSYTFDFGKETYQCKFNKKKFDDMPIPMEQNPEVREKYKRDAFNAAAEIKKVATFTVKFLYFQKPENGLDGQYYLRLEFPSGKKAVKCAFNYGAFSSGSEFKKAALKEPGAQFTGTTAVVDEIYGKGNKVQLREVSAIDYVGYVKEIGAYIYNDFAVEKGKVIKLNKDDFFQLEKVGIKTVFDGKQKLSTHAPQPFIADYLTAFNVKGLIAFAWWLGCLFVEQIRGHYSYYPFLEVIGDAGSGKSQMVDMLSKLVGKDADVFNPNFSTAVGKLRRLSSLSNLPVIFNETDNENDDSRVHGKKFLWDEHKDLAEGRIGRASGLKTNDNNVREPKFKGGLLVVQNVPVHASEAILSRFLHLQFDRSHHSNAGRQALARLQAMEIMDVSGYLLATLRKEGEIMTTFKAQYKLYGDELRANAGMKTQRVIDFHAMLKALIDCLVLTVPVPTDAIAQAQQKATEMAVEREVILRRAHPINEQFWANYEYINDKFNQNDPLSIPCLNHSSDPTRIAINLEHCRTVFAKHQLEAIETKELRKFLIASTKPKFVDKNVGVWSVIEQRTIKCWIFKA